MMIQKALQVITEPLSILTTVLMRFEASGCAIGCVTSDASELPESTAALLPHEQSIRPHIIDSRIEFFMGMPLWMHGVITTLNLT